MNGYSYMIWDGRMDKGGVGLSFAIFPSSILGFLAWDVSKLRSDG